ncbi:MAG: guanylate kinase, partial [Crocinitomicaceae bacterium]
IWSKKQVVVVDVDVIGGLRLKEIFSTQALSIFIQPPSIQELENRLRSRNTESDEKISMRVNKAKIELSKSTEFDVTIINEELTLAISEAKEQVLKFIEK